jgi:fatty-acyl-CoA synthase
VLVHLKSPGKVPDWCLPDQVLFVELMPLAATGKIDKRRLRDSLELKPVSGS